MQDAMGAVQGAAPKKRNWIKIILIAVAIFIGFVALIIGCVFSMGGPVMKSGESFLMMITAGKTDLAYESAAIQFKEEVSRETFDAFLAEYPILTKVKSVSFNQFSIENDVLASLSGTIVGTDGQVSPINMSLVKENDGWRVLYLDLNAPPLEGQQDQPAGQVTPAQTGDPGAQPPTEPGEPAPAPGDEPIPDDYMAPGLADEPAPVEPVEPEPAPEA